MLLAASRDVFSSMLGTDISRVPGKDRGGHDHFDGIMALIGFAGTVVGTGWLLCSPATACDLSSRLLMGEFATPNDDVLDAMGEITNMIVGGFKNYLEGRVGTIQMSIPTVVYGKNIAMRSGRKDVTVTATFSYAEHEFVLEVDLARNHAVTSRR